MALTDEGRALTESHRLAQIAIAARAESLGRILWPRLQVSNLDDPAWLGANVEAARRFFNQSVSLASEYVSEYRGVELGSDAGPIVGPEFDTATQRQALLLAGPVRVKMLVGGGMTGTAARAAARAKYGGILRRQVLSGGRMMINETTAADTRAIGWRRVSDGNPCAFCAMLVTRGPVYSSSGKAVATGGEVSDITDRVDARQKLSMASGSRLSVSRNSSTRTRRRRRKPTRPGSLAHRIRCCPACAVTASSAIPR